MVLRLPIGDRTLEDEMQLKFAATAAALALTCAVAVAQDAKPNDAQIAHIAYTAGD